MSRTPYVPSPADLEYTYDCACAGLPINKTCEGLHIDHKTFLKNVDKFGPYLKKGKAQFDLHIDRCVPEVVNTLLKRCTGYNYEETTVKEHSVGIAKDNDPAIEIEGTRKIIETTKTKKWLPGSVTAIIFFLTNRDKLHYKHLQVVDHNNSDESFKNVRPIFQIKDEALKKELENFAKKGGRESENERTVETDMPRDSGVLRI